MQPHSFHSLIDEIDGFNERFALVENEKAVFSIEYIEFHWNAAKNTGCLIGNRYGLVRLSKDLLLVASASGSDMDAADKCATKFVDGSDDIIILKEKTRHSNDAGARADRKRSERVTGECDETACLEKILESMNCILESLHDEKTEPAKIEWSGHNKLAFVTGTAFGLLLLARELVQFALSASFGDSYEVGPMRQDSGRLILILRDDDGENCLFAGCAPALNCSVALVR